jgi:hypothetical protein
MARVTSLDGNPLFTVEYMAWDKFFNVLMNPEENQTWWDGLKNIDCVLGTADYSISYM